MVDLVLTNTAREKARATSWSPSRLLTLVRSALESGERVSITTDWRTGQDQRVVELGDGTSALVKQGDDLALVIVDLLDAQAAARLVRRGEKVRDVKLVERGATGGARVYHATGLGIVREVHVTINGGLVLVDEKGAILCRTA